MTLLLSVLTTMTAWAEVVTYINANGQSVYVDAFLLDGTEPSLNAGWYYVDNDITYDGAIECLGDVHIILADGKTMTINCGGNGIHVNGSLTIYGQAKGTGTLNATSDYQGIHSDYGDITIYGGRVTATGEYGDGIHSDYGDITIYGGRVTATGDNTGISTDNGNITLGCTTASDFIYASSYFVSPGGSLKIADGQTLFDQYDNPYSDDGITIPNGVTLCSFFPNVIAQYIDAAGKPARCAAIPLYGGGSSLGQDGQETWYYVDNDITYDGTIDCDGDVHIILADGKTMTINSGNNGIVVYDGGSLTIYGQAKGTGTLNATGGGDGISTYSGNITICGGTVNATATATSEYAAGIFTYSGDITISGGRVTATATSENAAGIYTDSGNITLGWTTASDFIYASRYFGSVKIADGQTLYDEDGKKYSGTLSADKISAIRGKKLTPDLSPSLTRDGNVYTINNTTGWNYFCDMQEGGETFSGKTVVLASDIGTPEDPVTRMGSSTTRFKGTFDGQGHTLTVQYGTASEPVDQQFVAPFPVVEGAATFRNLTIAGSIYSGYATNGDKGTGGLIGCLRGGVTVEHCVSTVTVNAASDRAGGFVGHCEHAVTFTDCVSSAIVTCTGSGSGFVGWSRASEYTIAFYGCLFDGKVLKQGNVGSGNGSFVGWKGFTKTVTITNCLAAPATDENMATDNSATFCRYSADTSTDNQATTITNCYYTQTLGAAQGKARHTITAGTDVTVAHAGVATHYATSGITAYKATGASTDSAPFIAGLLYNDDDSDVLYAGIDDEVALTLSNTATGGDVPAGYRYDIYTVSAGTLSGSTLTMPDANVTVNVDTETLRSTGQAVSVSYIGANGQPASHDAIALDGTESTLGEDGQETWYFVGTGISYSDRISCYGDVHIILADGKTMTINSDGICIEVNGSLTIYGQAKGTGTLNVTSGIQGIFSPKGDITISGGTVKATCTFGNGISTYRGTITISGGTVNATATGDNAGIYTNSGTITISGGTVTATGGNGAGIYTESGTITICGGTVATGGIYTNSGTITISGGRVTVTGDGDGIHSDSGTITISGGRVTAKGGYGIFTSSGTITLGCTTASDFIYASNYLVGPGGRLKIANGQTLYDEDGNYYSDQIIDYPYGKTLRPFPYVNVYDSEDNSEAINGSNGQQRNVFLYGRTLYKDGEWNTLCLPFDVSTISGPLSGDNVQAMILNNSEGSGTGFDASTGVLTLNFSDATSGEQQGLIPAGTPFIVRWGTPDDNPGTALTDPVFEKVNVKSSLNEVPFTGGAFKGTYAWQEYTQENKSILLLGAENTLYWPQPDGDTYPSIGAFRAYFELGGGQEAREFVLNFGEIETSLPQPLQREGSQAGAWFDLSGRKLSDKPTKKGVYILNGKRVVVK